MIEKIFFLLYFFDSIRFFRIKKANDFNIYFSTSKYKHYSTYKYYSATLNPIFYIKTKIPFEIEYNNKLYYNTLL